MVREQYVTTTQDSSVPRQVPDHVYKIGIYGWRKRCLYLFVLLLIIILVVNFALTIWILRVMWFNTEGMGLLQVHSDGIKLEGESEFLMPLYAQEIHSRKDASLLVNASENVYLNARNENGDVTDRIAIEPNKVQAHAQSLDMRTLDGNMLFRADGKEAEVGPGKLRVTGAEGALFQHSVEVPLISGRTDELQLECPTRALSMEGPKGVVISALNGNIEVASNMDILLQSTKDGLVLDTQMLKMPNLPKSEGEESGNAQGLYEVCVCPSGRVVVSKAGLTSTCSGSQDC